MNLLSILGIVLMLVSLPQMFGFMRRRAADRGMSGSIIVPFILIVIGFVTFLVGTLV